MTEYKRTYSGITKWFKDAEYHILHREDGPAVVRPGNIQCWYINGERHREDGPAIIWADDSYSWYIDGKKYLDKKKFQKAAKLSDEDMTALLLKYNW